MVVVRPPLLTGLVAALLGLASCSANSTAVARPAWALGEQPNFSGTVQDWAKGDAIAPGEGGIFATTYPKGNPEVIEVGYGLIHADGSFKFGLQRGAAAASGGVPPVKEQCPAVRISNPNQRFVLVHVLRVLDLYEEGVHARPGGAILISIGKPITPAMQEVYTFVYASGNGTLKGQCALSGGESLSLDLDLYKGWNSVKLNPNAPSFSTAAIPRAAKWYFINPLTVPAP